MSFTGQEIDRMHKADVTGRTGDTLGLSLVDRVGGGLVVWCRLQGIFGLLI